MENGEGAHTASSLGKAARVTPSGLPHGTCPAPLLGRERTSCSPGAAGLGLGWIWIPGHRLLSLGKSPAPALPFQKGCLFTNPEQTPPLITTALF